MNYNASKAKGKTCTAENVREETLKRAVVIAWNSMVENREKHLPFWESQILEGDALEKYRAEQMKEMTGYGLLEEEVPEMTRMIFNEITVIDAETISVSLMDGTEIRVSL